MKRQVIILAALIAVSGNAFAQVRDAKAGKSIEAAREKRVEDAHLRDSVTGGKSAGQTVKEVGSETSAAAAARKESRDKRSAERFDANVQKKIEQLLAVAGSSSDSAASITRGLVDSLKADLTTAEREGVLRFLGTMKNVNSLNDLNREVYDYIKKKNLDKKEVESNCKG